MRGKQLLFHPPCAVCEQQKSSGFHFGVLVLLQVVRFILCIQVSKNEWLQLEKRTYPFIYAFFDRYEPMAEVEKEDRVKLIEKHWQRVRSFHRSFLTYREWPDVEDRRVMLNAGIFMDLGDLRAYLKEVATQQQIDNYINDATCSHVFKTGEKFFRKVKQMRIRDVDVAALMCLIFWLDAEQQMNITSSRIVEYQERVMAEWVANLIANYGEAEANKRLAKMLYIRLDLEAMAVVMKNASLLTDLLWPKDEKHLLREMSTERPAYLEILRKTADATTFPTPRSLLSFL
ncbi:hypothetical protein M3Y99_00425900 [Aphelenchoides fujianensis]|nr:hypothetical protein M3Y99_00425900 [Aphelenchoides fujianensis]